jgi:phage baseplate assembly protein gpV
VTALENMVGEVDESITELSRKFPGVVTGRVINLLDPLMLGRVQVQLPFIDALDLSPWARVATPMAGLLHGHYFLPNVGDEVLVAFEHGDVRAPYVIGSLWTAIARPPLPSPVPQIRAIRTIGGNQVVFTELPPSITIQTNAPPSVLPAPGLPTGPHQTISITPAGVQITTPVMVDVGVATTKINVTPGSVVVTMGGNTVSLTPAGVQIRGPTVTIQSDGPLTLRGNPILIN